MGTTGEHPKVMRIMAACSRYPDALQWTRSTVEDAWGPIALSSDVFVFDQTDYYAATMGTDLLKMFFALERLVEPSELVAAKHSSNAWELSYGRLHSHPEPRPLNLDPGYISQAKLVLASTKDHSHRIYLRDGIYAEVTLFYQHKRWRHGQWTYPDYRRDEYHAFFTRCRDYLRSGTHSTITK